MNYEQILADIGRLFTQTREHLIVLIPKLIMALLILLTGFLIARLFRTLSSKLLIKIGDLLPATKLQGNIKSERLDRYSGLVGNIIFWIVFFFFLTTATEVIGLPIMTAWLSNFIQYLPNVLAAVLIGFIGIIGGAIVRDLIVTAAGSADIASGQVLGKFAQAIILLVAMVVAIQQIGIDIAFLTGIVSIALAALLFGAALSFALGARTSISNILAGYYLNNQIAIGDRVSINGCEGRIIQITPTAVILESEDGLVNIPAKKFSEEISTLLKKDDQNE